MTAAIFSPTTKQSSQTIASDCSWQCEALTARLCDQLQAEWAGLANSASEPNIFQSASFVSNSLPLLADQSPKLIAIRDAGLLIGLVMLSRDIGYAKLPIPFWRSALHYEQFLGTPLVRKGHEERFAAGLCAWLDNAPLDCSFLKLSMIGAEGPVAKAIARYCREDQRNLLTTNCFERAAIAGAENGHVEPEELLSTNRRKSMRKATTRLAQQGVVMVERLSDPAQLHDWTAHFLDLENTGWKREEGSSILSCEHETALYKRVISDAFDEGNLNFSRLCLDGQPIAYTLDIASPAIVFCLKSAIDQRYRKFSPGVLMEYETLKHYLTAEDMTFADSCSAPDNAMLNELWPNRRAIMDLAIERKGAPHSMIFRAAAAIKMHLNSASRI